MCFKLKRNGTKNGSSNLKDPSAERSQLQMHVLHRSLRISKPRPSSLRHVRAEYNDNAVSDSHQNIGTSCNSKLKLPKIKDLRSKSTEKLFKDE